MGVTKGFKVQYRCNPGTVHSVHSTVHPGSGCWVSGLVAPVAWRDTEQCAKGFISTDSSEVILEWCHHHRAIYNLLMSSDRILNVCLNPR